MSRLIRVSDDLFDFIGTRSERGNRLSYEWGEPDADGVYEPTITEHADDNLLDSASEYGRLLAERDRLIAEGIDPGELDVPMRPRGRS